MSSSTRKNTKRRMWVNYRKNNLFTPFMFDGDPSSVEKVVRSKYPDIPNSYIYQFEELVMNPPDCTCCVDNFERPPVIKMKNNQGD